MEIWDCNFSIYSCNPGDTFYMQKLSPIADTTCSQVTICSIIIVNSSSLYSVSCKQVERGLYLVKIRPLEGAPQPVAVEEWECSYRFVSISPLLLSKQHSVMGIWVDSITRPDERWLCQLFHLWAQLKVMNDNLMQANMFCVMWP